jgi:hypothetical protein
MNREEGKREEQDVHPRLDPQTLDAVAELICGDAGPLYRRGWELPLFFRRAGIEAPEFDGPSRGEWVRDQLSALPDSEVERVLLRLADPREYKGLRDNLEAATKELNAILEAEGIAVVFEGRTPRLRAADEIPAVRSVPTEPPDFGKLTPSLAPLLTSRWHETDAALRGGAYLAALVMMGSLLEGALYAAVVADQAAASSSHAVPKDRVTGKPREISQWTLSDLINVAHECGWIQVDVRDFSHVVRDYRNLIHPAKQHQVGFVPDRDTCMICWEVVRAAMNDLLDSAS